MSRSNPFSLSCLARHSLTFTIPFLLVAAAYSQPTVTVISPTSGSSAGSPVFYEAFASSQECDKGIAAMRIYSAPSVDAVTVMGGHIETFIALSPGTYSTVVQAWDNCGGVGKTDVALTVTSKAGVSVYLPNRSTDYWPVHVAASAENPDCAAGINAIRIYTAAGISSYTVNSNKLDAYLTLQPGSYNLTVQAWDNCGNVFKSQLVESVVSSPDAYLYASGVDQIAELEINSDGSLKNPNGSGFPSEFPASTASTLAVDPGGWFVFASSDVGIYGFEINRSNGALIPLPGSPFPFNITQLGDQGPPTILMDPAGNFVYLTYHGGGGGSATAGIATYRIDRSTGTLTWTGFALYFGGGSSPFGSVESPVTDATGRYLYCLCGESTAQLLGYSVNPNNGHLTALSGSPFSFMGTPASSGSYVYLGTETSLSPGNLIGLRINSSNGNVSQLQGSPFSAGSPGWPVDAVWADWRTKYLWGFESQNQTAATNGLQAFTIDSSTGSIAASKTFLNLPLVYFFSLVEDHTGTYVFTGMTKSATTSGPDLASWNILSDGTLKQINSEHVLSGTVESIAVATKNPR